MTIYRDHRPLTPAEDHRILELLRQGYGYHALLALMRLEGFRGLKTCHVAEVKRRHGIGTRGAWNSGQTGTYSLS
jgi:hypothetical protein